MVIIVRNDTYPAVAEICGIKYYIIPYTYASIIGPELRWSAADLVSMEIRIRNTGPVFFIFHAFSRPIGDQRKLELKIRRSQLRTLIVTESRSLRVGERDLFIGPRLAMSTIILKCVAKYHLLQDALFAQIHAHWTLTIWIAIAYALGIHKLQKWVSIVRTFNAFMTVDECSRRMGGEPLDKSKAR